MAGLLVDLLISESIHHNFDFIAAFRFRLDYVNSLKSRQYYVVLHNLNNWEICQIVKISTPVRNHNL